MKFSRDALGFIATGAYLTGDFEGSVEAAEIAGDAIINLPAWQAASHMKLGDPEGAGAVDGAVPRPGAARLDAATATPPKSDVIDWFIGCFPIRSDEVKADLHAQLQPRSQP